MIPIDEPIPDDEELYRGVGPVHVDGDKVLPSVIDMQGTSVYRAKYCDPSPPVPPIRLHHPDENGIIVITPARLPIWSHGDTGFVFFVIHVPEEGDAHCEIHVRRSSEPEHQRSTTKVLKKKKPVRQLLKNVLAERFEVLIPPRQ